MGTTFTGLGTAIKNATQTYQKALLSNEQLREFHNFLKLKGIDDISDIENISFSGETDFRQIAPIAEELAGNIEIIKKKQLNIVKEKFSAASSKETLQKVAIEEEQVRKEILDLNQKITTFENLKNTSGIIVWSQKAFASFDPKFFLDAIETLKTTGKKIPQNIESFLKKNTEVPKLVEELKYQPEFHPTYFRLGDKYGKTYYVSGMADAIDYVYLEYLVNVPNISVVVNHNAIDKQKLRKKINNYISDLQHSLYYVKRDEQIDIQHQINDYKRLQEELRGSSDESAVQATILVTIYGNNLSDIDGVYGKIKSNLEEHGVFLSLATFRQKEAFKNMRITHNPNAVPFNYDTMSFTTTTNVLANATLDLYNTKGIQDGIFYGFDLFGRGVFCVNRFKSSGNFNGIIIAPPGSGKSYFLKMEAFRHYVNDNVNIIIVDPENEYEALTRYVGGTHIHFDQSGRTKINVFDFSSSGIIDAENNPLAVKISFLKGFFGLFFADKDIPVEELSQLESILLGLYEEKGITEENIHNLHMDSTPVPEINDLITMLNKKNCPNMANYCISFSRGDLSAIFSGKTNVDMSADWVSFNIRDVSELNKPYIMMIINDLAWQQMSKDPNTKRLVYVDEFWAVANNDYAIDFFAGLFKRARKYNAGITIVNQDFNIFQNENKNMETILLNSFYKIIFNPLTGGTKSRDEIMDSIAGRVLRERFQWGDTILNGVFQLRKGQAFFEGGDIKKFVEFAVTDKERIFFETNKEYIKENHIEPLREKVIKEKNDELLKYRTLQRYTAIIDNYLNASK